jgi:hypothetical protein
MSFCSPEVPLVDQESVKIKSTNKHKCGCDVKSNKAKRSFSSWIVQQHPPQLNFMLQREQRMLHSTPSTRLEFPTPSPRAGLLIFFNLQREFEGRKRHFNSNAIGEATRESRAPLITARLLTSRSDIKLLRKAHFN